MGEARAENDSIRRKREEEEKIAKQHQEVMIIKSNSEIRVIGNYIRKKFYYNYLYLNIMIFSIVLYRCVCERLKERKAMQVV